MDISNKTREIHEKLRKAVSMEEGVGILHENAGELDDTLASLLRAESLRLRDSDDREGADEFLTWADEARSIVTRNIIFKSRPTDAEEALAIVQANRERFDNVFVQLCVRVATELIGKLHAILEGATQDDPQVLVQAKDLAAAASREITFISLVCSVTEIPEHRAQALLTGGLFLLLEALLAERLGDSEAAERSRERSRTLLTECAGLPGASKQVRARAEGNLAVLAGPKNLAEVKERQKNAQKLAEESGDREMARRVRRDRAFWFTREGSLNEALELYAQNIADTEDALYGFSSPIQWAEEIAAAQPDYDNAVETCMALAQRDESFYERALEYTEKAKARTFLRSLASVASSGSETPPRLIERRQEILLRMKSFGSDPAAFPPDLAEKKQREAEALRMAFAATEAAIEAHTASAALDLQCVPCAFPNMKSLAPRDSAILSLYSLPEKLLLFLLDENGFITPPRSIDLSRRDLAKALVNIDLTLRVRSDHQAHDELQRKLDMEVDHSGSTQSLRYLYEQIIEPIRDDIDDKNMLYIAPHANLRDLPFHALIESEGRFLVDSFAVAYTPSLSVLRQCQRKARSNFATCFSAGVGAGSGGSETAMEEAALVAGLFGTTPRSCSASELSSGASDVDVVHLACPGDATGGRHGIQWLTLEDGPLGRRQIAALRSRASLVCLSACETAHAGLLPMPGAETPGLVGSFIRAGVPSVMAALWPLSDQVALPFMRTLYEELRGGINKAEALRIAQRAIKSDPRYAHPYYWAPLCLWGAI